jgi:hypothetical protein
VPGDEPAGSAHGRLSELLGMRAAGSVTVRHVISKTPKNQWYVAEAAKVMRSFRRERDRPLLGGLRLNLWLGWVIICRH